MKWAHTDLSLLTSAFPADLNFALFMVAAPVVGGNVLTKGILDIVFELDESILALEVSTRSPLDRTV